MNAVEIEQAITDLAEQPFDAAKFPYAFLEAFGNKETTIKRLRAGASNKSDLGGVLQTNNIHIKVCTEGEVTKEAAAQAVQLNPDLWQGHAALAAVHTCLWEWDEAAISFGAALERNEPETRDYSAYAFYLLAVGKRDEALHLVKDKAERKEGDPSAERIYPLFLYATRQFKEAERPLRNLHDKYETDWLIMLTLVLVFLALERYELALKVNGRLINVMRHMAFEPEIWPGLTVLAYARLGGIHEKSARDKLTELEEYHKKTGHREPTQLALMYMALGESEKAITELARGCDDRHPSMIWLHIWPIFDPLRDHPKFQELIGRMKLPALK